MGSFLSTNSNSIGNEIDMAVATLANKLPSTAEVTKTGSGRITIYHKTSNYFIDFSILVENYKPSDTWQIRVEFLKKTIIGYHPVEKTPISNIECVHRVSSDPCNLWQDIRNKMPMYIDYIVEHFDNIAALENTVYTLP